MSSPRRPPADPTEALARQFITDVREGHQAPIDGKLGQRMRAALTAEKLTTTWAQLTGPMGAFEALELSQGTDQQGYRVYVHLARYAKGGLQVTTAVDPRSGTVEGFFLKPAEPAVSRPAPPASYVHPEAFTAKELKVGAAPFELGATLTLPDGAGPFPAVVLVHGSGPHDRDETVSGNKPFKDLAEGLASRGVAVLRYEKRTHVYGAKYVGKPITMDEEVVLDALAAVALLQHTPKVDPARVFVLGHSLGALLAPEIASRAQKVAGVICLAPPARKPWDVLVQQLRYLQTPEDQVTALEKQFATVKSGQGHELVMGAPADYWREWASKDGVAVAKKLKVPVLVLRGSRDYQVIAEDFAAWKSGLSGIATAQVEELPGLNHLFFEGDGPSTPAEYERPSHVQPAVIERLVRFLAPPH